MIKIIVLINRFLRYMLKMSYRIQFKLQWSGENKPEYFDHYIDLYFLWGEKYGNCFFLERGIFSLLAMKKDCAVLELCCGDGFNAKYFYSYRAKEIIAIDYDKTAIAHARLNNHCKNIIWINEDIRTYMTDKSFDNIIWDAGLAYFSEKDIDFIMDNIKKRLKVDGIFSGSTIVKRPDLRKQIKYHKYEFESKEDLMRFLNPYFKNVNVFETIYPERHNLYFWASDGELPFSDTWEYSIKNKN